MLFGLGEGDLKNPAGYRERGRERDREGQIIDTSPAPDSMPRHHSRAPRLTSARMLNGKLGLYGANAASHATQAIVHHASK